MKGIEITIGDDIKAAYEASKVASDAAVDAREAFWGQLNVEMRNEFRAVTPSKHNYSFEDLRAAQRSWLRKAGRAKLVARFNQMNEAQEQADRASRAFTGMFAGGCTHPLYYMVCSMLDGSVSTKGIELLAR